MEELPEIDRILIKLSYKAKREALRQLKEEHKDNPKVLKKLKILEEKLPKNY